MRSPEQAHRSSPVKHILAAGVVFSVSALGVLECGPGTQIFHAKNKDMDSRWGSDPDADFYEISHTSTVPKSNATLREEMHITKGVDGAEFRASIILEDTDPLQPNYGYLSFFAIRDVDPNSPLKWALGIKKGTYPGVDFPNLPESNTTLSCGQWQGEPVCKISP